MSFFRNIGNNYKKLNRILKMFINIKKKLEKLSNIESLNMEIITKKKNENKILFEQEQEKLNSEYKQHENIKIKSDKYIEKINSFLQI